MGQVATLRSGDGLSDAALVAALNQIFTSARHVGAVQARVRQVQAAAALGTGRRSLEGLGRPRLELDPVVYHYWGQRLGYECWRDAQFVREFERDNPEVRVRATGTRVQSGYRGPVRERVVYGAERKKEEDTRQK
jgi:hypothetical protein